jgi:hypothetical protein
MACVELLTEAALRRRDLGGKSHMNYARRLHSCVQIAITNAQRGAYPLLPAQNSESLRFGSALATEVMPASEALAAQ